LWVYIWLRQSKFRDLIDSDLRLSLMAASAARWATLDRSKAAAVALGCMETRGLVCGFKPRALDASMKVEYMELEKTVASPDGLFGFFTLLGPEIDRFHGWYPIPK
jgi:methanobactin biosynthesis cassette protein MbnC